MLKIRRKELQTDGHKKTGRLSRLSTNLPGPYNFTDSTVTDWNL